MEKVISEFKVIETDDGFRIEIKGDKEKIRSFFTRMGGQGPMHFRHRGGWGGPWGMHGFRHGMGPWWGGWDAESEEKGDQPKQA